MGFFDRFVQSLSNWSFNWSGAGESLESAWEGARNLFLTNAAATNNLLGTHYSDDEKENTEAFNLSWDLFFNQAQSAGQAVGGVFGAAAEMPVIRQAFAFAEDAQDELVRRPMATGYLMTGDAGFSGDFGTFFDLEAWNEAYNTTTHVTPGQAGMYALASSNALYGFSPEENQRRDLLRAFPNLGMLMQGRKTVDPRTPIGRRVYYENDFMKGMSGTLDAAIVLVADPTALLGKFARAAKLRYISEPMTSAAIQSGRLTAHIKRKTYQRTRDFIFDKAEKGATSEAVWRQLFANHYDGELAAALLYDAARTQPHYERMGGRVDLYDTTFRALYGDQGAWTTLAGEAPRLAASIGSGRASETLGNVARNYGTGDRVGDAQWDKAAVTKVQSWLDGVINERGVWGELQDTTRAGGLLTGQTLPKVRATSTWRVGTHTAIRGLAAPTKFGFWARRAHYALPSQRSGRMLDVNDPNSVGVLRATLSRSRMSQEDLDRWVSAYARASSPQTRFAIYGQAEDYAFRLHAQRYGLSQPELEASIRAINEFRRGNRQILANNRRYASSDVQRLYEQRLSEAREGEAHVLAELAQDIDDAASRGDWPNAYYTLPDEDGNLALIPEDTAQRIDSPITSSQYAEMTPMVDWHVLENALWWHAGFGFGKPGRRSTALERVGKGFYSAQDFTRATLEAVMTVWKVTAIMRPGYVWRTISDELARTMAKHGAWANLATMGRSPGHIQANMRARGRLLREIADTRKYRARANGVNRLEFDAEAIVAGKPLRLEPEPMQMATDARFGLLEDSPLYATSGQEGGLVYRSYEAAFADGLFSVDDLLSVIDLHGRAGVLPAPLAEAWGSLGEKALTKRQYRNQVINYVLRQTGRGAFTNPAWQRNLVRQVRRGKEYGEVTLIDPLTGMSPEYGKPERVALEYEIVGQPVDIHRRGNQLEEDALYDYIADNFDTITEPRSLLAAELTPDGQVRLSVRRHIDPDGEPVKPTAGMRVGLPITSRQGDLLRDSGTMEIQLNTPAGSARLSGAFEGDEGDRFRHQASARGPQDAWVDAVTDTEFARFKAYSGRWEEYGPDRGKEYDVAWERAVKEQLAHDAVAVRFMRGWTVDEIIAWLHDTKAGNQYLRDMGGAWVSRYAENVIAIQAMVDTYLPFDPARQAESLNLRVKAANRTVTVDDLAQVVDRRHMPRVNGAEIESGTGRGWFMDRVKRATDHAFHWLSDLPTDKLVRYPFAAEAYKRHAETIVEQRASELAKEGDYLQKADLESVERLARRRALRDVQRYLYNTNATYDLAKMARLFVPFGAAISDSLLKWGVVLRENPYAGVQLWKLWNAPENAGLIQDQDGNELEMENGKEVWYGVNPKTGERERLEDHKPQQKMIVFRLPSWMKPDQYGDDSAPVVRVNKNVFRTFLDMPSAGPLIAVPANKFALDNPEFGESKFVRDFILPYGPTSDTVSAMLPANLRNLRSEILPNFFKEDKEYTESQTIAIFAADMVDYSLGQRPNAPTFEEAREKANAMRGLRFWWRFMGVSPQFVSPYQPYVDYYHQLRLREHELRQQAVDQGQDPGEVPAADELFYRQMGPEYFSLTASVTRNVAGIPATVESHKAWNKYKDLIAKHPDIASLIIGAEGAGEFARSVYEGQKLTETRPGSGEMMRQRLSPEDSWEDVQRRQGWLEYGKFMDLVHTEMSRMGVTSLQQVAAQRIKQARDAWIEQRMFVVSPWGETTMNPWYEDFRSIDSSRMTGRLHSMREIIKDPRLQGRNDVRGLIDYLDYRDRFRAYMQRLGYASLGTEEASTLRQQWQMVVYQLKDENVAFSALHDRWLTGDEDLVAE